MEVEERVQGGAAIRQIPAVAFVIALLSAAARAAGLQIAARPESNPPSDRRESGVSRRRRYAPDFPPLASTRPLLLLAFWLSRLLRGQARGSPKRVLGSTPPRLGGMRLRLARPRWAF